MNTYGYVGGNPLRFIDPFGLETTVIVTFDSYFGIDVGSHSAVHVDNDGFGSPVIFDPAGSFANSTRGSGGLISPEQGTLEDFVNYHKQLGSRVETFTFKTSPEDEAAIYRRAESIGDPRGLSCAVSVSQALDGIGPFKELGGTGFPGRLADRLRNLQTQQIQK